MDNVSNFLSHEIIKVSVVNQLPCGLAQVKNQRQLQHTNTTAHCIDFLQVDQQQSKGGDTRESRDMCALRQLLLMLLFGKDTHKRTCPWSQITTLWPLCYFLFYTRDTRKETLEATLVCFFQAYDSLSPSCQPIAVYCISSFTMWNKWNVLPN